jgi:hypothetical protein
VVSVFYFSVCECLENSCVRCSSSFRSKRKKPVVTNENKRGLPSITHVQELSNSLYEAFQCVSAIAISQAQSIVESKNRRAKNSETTIDPKFKDIKVRAILLGNMSDWNSDVTAIYSKRKKCVISSFWWVYRGLKMSWFPRFLE